MLFECFRYKFVNFFLRMQTGCSLCNIEYNFLHWSLVYTFRTLLLYWGSQQALLADVAVVNVMLSIVSTS